MWMKFDRMLREPLSTPKAANESKFPDAYPSLIKEAVSGLGGLFSVFGLDLSYFAKVAGLLVFSYGALVGIGLSLVINSFLSQISSYSSVVGIGCKNTFTMSTFKRIMERHGPIIVFIPGILAVHWAWFRLQENETFVPREIKDNNPFNFMKRKLRSLFGNVRSGSSETDSSTSK